MKQSLGEFISTLRKAQGYTQAEVAERLNISNRTLSSWETDRTAPDVAVLPALADIYGVTVDEILRCERQAKNAEEKQLSQTAEAAMRKNRFSKFCGKRILCFGLGLLGSAIFVGACALLLYTVSPLWLDILLMILGACGNAACIILLSFFYYSALRSEGIIFDTDYTEEKCAYATTLRHKFANTFIFNSLPYILGAIVYLIVYFAAGLNNNGVMDVSGVTVTVDYTTPTVASVILNCVFGLSMLIFGIAYDKAGIKKSANDKQKETAAFNRKTARKIYGIGAIFVGVLFIGAIIFLIIPIRIENVEFHCNEYDELISHMHTLEIDDANDNNGKIPHGSYKLLFPTEISFEDVNNSKRYDLGNGFSGICYETTFWVSRKREYSSFEWLIDYLGEYYCYTPVLKLEIGETTQYLAAIPYKDWSFEQFVPEGTDAHFEVRYKDGFEIIYVTTLSEIKSGALATAIGSVITYITVCTIIYLAKRKSIEYKF